MKIQLIFHGSLRKYNHNKSETVLEISQDTKVEEIILQMNMPHDVLAFSAVNGSRVPSNHVLQEGDELTFFPIGRGG